MNIHEHVKCPRCHVALGRHDIICWACRHVVKAPGIYIKYFWLFWALKLAGAALVIVFLLKYKEQVGGVMQAAMRSMLKH